MKINKLATFAVAVAVMALGFTSCNNNEDIQLNTPGVENTNVYVDMFTAMFAEFADILGIDVNIEVIDVFKGIDVELYNSQFDGVSTRNLATQNDWDVDNSMTMKLATSSGDNFTTITTPHRKSPNTISYAIMSETGDFMSFVADFFIDENTGMMYIEFNDEIEYFFLKWGRFQGWGQRWKDCMDKFVDMFGSKLLVAYAVGTFVKPIAIVATGFIITAAVGCSANS